ncbi:hypothetical protein ACFU6S_18865 [Streptomyces sp. NPDC057456]|uniref:hypothetical protein n=1 Tax=Streptomyces sp. NPDC057456 TaxID=3346139 RepID=UPI003675592E
MLEITRDGPIPYPGVAVLKACQPAPGTSWTNPSARLATRTTSGVLDISGARPFPLDLGFVPSRVQQANCRWAGLKGPQTVPGSLLRKVGEPSNYDVYDELNRWALGDGEENDYTTYAYECGECGLRFGTTEGPNVADVTHPTEDVVMDTGFAFDTQRKLFVASDAPGTLVVLMASEHRPFGWGKPLPRASFAYAREHGLMAGRQPVYEGQWPVHEGSSWFHHRYNYAVLRST